MCRNMIPSSFAINNFSEEKDPITQAYRKKPSQEQILEIAKSKGYIYQRKSKDQNQSTQIASKRYKSGLKIDWAAWINSIKMSVPVLELLRIPSQRASFFKALGMVQQINDENSPKDEEIKFKDLNYYMANEYHQPFFLTLNINDCLLHNCMIDSGASTNVMTKKIME